MTYKKYIEEDLIPLSALQHLLFCERQCALIYIEQLWTENLFTAEGKIMHERVDAGDRESRRDIRIEYGMPLRSLRLGVVGKVDVVEFHRKGNKWLPFLVEHKRGKPKQDNSDKVQLCAQAICLEEMLEVDILAGALFYGKTRRRLDVIFDADLRRETEETAKRLHELIESGVTPKPVYTRKCKSCSLVELCLPERAGQMYSVKKYIEKAVQGE